MDELHIFPRLLVDRHPSDMKIMLDCSRCCLLLVGTDKERVVSLGAFKADWPESAARWGDFLMLVGKEVLSEAVRTAAAREHRKQLVNGHFQDGVVA